MGSACCKSQPGTSSKAFTVDVPNSIIDETKLIMEEESTEFGKNEKVDNEYSCNEKTTNAALLTEKTGSGGTSSLGGLSPGEKILNRKKNTSMGLKLNDLHEEVKQVGKRTTTQFLFKSKEPSTDLLGLEISESEAILEDELSISQEEIIKETLEQLNLLKGLDEETIIKLDEKVLYNKGDDAAVFYIIDSGCVEFTSNEKSFRLHAGDYFGLESLGENQLRCDTAKALGSVTLLSLPGEHYRNAHEYMKLKTLDEKKSALKQIPILKNLDQIKIIQLCQSIVEKTYAEGSIIISEEENFDRIYIVKEGAIRLSKNMKRFKRMEGYNFFGDVFLFVKKFSYFTYSTETAVQTYELPFNAIKEVLSDNFYKIILYRLFISAISKSERINEYLYENIDDLYNNFTLKYYTNDEVVFPSNTQKNKKICIIISGRLRKQNKSEIIAKNEDIFGESIIDSKTNLETNIVSEDITLTLEADWMKILKSFKFGSKHNAVCLYDTVNRMRKIPLFSTLSEIKLFQLAKKMRKETFNHGEEIIKEGSEGEKFYIIKSGKVKVFQRGKFVREMENGSCFGEISVFKGIIRTVTVISSENNTECFVLAKDSFNDVVDMALLKHLQKIFALQDVNVGLENLYYVKTLGIGRFGKVTLVHNQKNFYAVKYAHIKSICKKENLMKYYINEKNIMLKTDYPFIIKLVKTMKAKEFLFFLLEYIDGVPLKSYLDKRKKTNLKNPYETAFYGAILLCVINYLHKKRILHRDIKPDNCMIDKNGYLKVIDFGVAKMLKDKDYTTTCCGTPHYLAPEVILGKGYSYSADYWSIGVSMFEIFYGYVPFGTSTKDMLDIYKEIVNKNLVLPYDPRYNDINNFFKIILSKNLIQRVCNFNLVRSHPFFHQFDFDLLTDFSIKPPFVPESMEQNLTGGISLLSHTNVPFNKFIEQNAKYDEEFSETEEVFINDKKWADEF